MGTHQPIRKTVTPEIPDKLYFRIGDVARLCEVPAYVLRFWETEFPQLKPNKGGTGQRLYRKRDVEMALTEQVAILNRRLMAMTMGIARNANRGAVRAGIFTVDQNGDGKMIEIEGSVLRSSLNSARLCANARSKPCTETAPMRTSSAVRSPAARGTDEPSLDLAG